MASPAWWPMATMSMSWSWVNWSRAARPAGGHRAEAGTGLDVGVEDAQRGVPALDRHADGLADLVVDDRLRRAESLVARGVGGDDALALLQDVVDDRLRDGHPLVGLGRLAPSHRLGDELAGLVLEQDRAAVGADRLEDQLEDLGREGVDVQDVADRLGGAVHDRQGHQPLAEPAGGGVRGLQDPRALVRGDAPEDGRAVVGAAPGQQVDPGRQVAHAPPVPPSWNSMTVWPSWTRSPECKRRLVDRLVVDVGPVRRTQIDDLDTLRGRACSSAWRRDTSLSWSCTAFELSLPRATGLDVNSNRLPWSAPWMTNKEATRQSLLGSDATSRANHAAQAYSG